MSAETARDHESPQRPDVASRLVLATVLGFFGFVLVAIAGLFAYYMLNVPAGLIASPRTFPAPHLQTDSHGDLERLQAAQRKTLSTYTWVDPNKGLIQIPIDRAMQLIVARGQHALDPLALPAVTPAPGSRGGAVP
jgi:fatty acid desaturase